MRPRCSRRPHSDATALPQRCHRVLSNTLWKRQAAAFVLSMLLQSVSTALLVFAQRAPRRSAFFNAL